MNVDYYPLNIINGPSTIHISHSFYNKEFDYDVDYNKDVTLILGKGSGYKLSMAFTNKHKYTPLEFRSGDQLTSKAILPNIKTKDFIIALAKTFNFDLLSEGGLESKLLIDIKKYTMSPDVLMIDDEKEINVKNLNFSKLVLTNGFADSPLLEDYSINNKEAVYAQKIINTGYSIKDVQKKIEIPYSTTIWEIDRSAFGYDYFGKYYNGGYAKRATGTSTGLSDKIVFGYLNRVDDYLYLVDDHLGLEIPINDDNSPDSPEFSHCNLNVLYDGSLPRSLQWSLTNDYNPHTIKADSYWTFSPHKNSRLV